MRSGTDDATRVGAITFNEVYFREIDRCPAVVFLRDGTPRCDAFGSGGPFIKLKRPCRYGEFMFCPVRRYGYVCEELIEELKEWLAQNRNLEEVQNES